MGRSAVDVLHTRVELLVLEIAEEQVRLAEILFYAALSLLCVFLAVVIVAVFVVGVLWDTEYRVVAIGSIAVLLAAAGAVCGTLCVRKAKVKPRLFSASLEELEADRERMR